MREYIKQMLILMLVLGLAMFAVGCSEDDNNGTGPMDPTPFDPDTAPKASVDRFSATSGHLMIRTETNGLPGANEAIDFDSGEPFITMGLGPGGEIVQYYNFDIQLTAPAPIYVLFREGEDTPVSGQLNIVNVIPGDVGYNDFWLVTKVTVPSSYVANTVASYAAIVAAGYEMEATTTLVNCPIVPDGSTASMRAGGESNALHRGWYKDNVVFYFTFEEKALVAQNGMVPLSPIYVTFNINPGEPNGGPASGFKTETGTTQTHNVIATLPSDDTYSPLWHVSAYNNTDFDLVMDWESAQMAQVLEAGIAMVNCPVVSIE